MASNTDAVKLGPCRVTFDVGGASPIVLETTKGGVTLTYEETTKEVTIDQYGNTPIKEYVVGRTATILVPIAEYDLDKLAKMIPGATLTTNATTPSKKRIDVDASKIIDLYDYAKVVKLEPLDAGASANEAVTLYKAAPRPNFSFGYNFDNERVVNVTFKAYPDVDGQLIGFGDQTA